MNRHAIRSLILLVPAVGMLASSVVLRRMRRPLPSLEEVLAGAVVDGVVVDEKGVPVEGAFAWLPYADSPGPAGDVGRSDREGRYRIHLHPRDSRVLVAHPDGRAALVRLVPKGGGETSPLTDLPTLGRAVLVPVPPLTGRVVDTRGDPVAGVVVDARPVGTGLRGLELRAGAFLLHQPPTFSTTGPDGRFSIPASLPLPHWLSLPGFEGGLLGIRGQYDDEPNHLVEEGVVEGTPGEDPSQFRVIEPAILPFAVVDAATGEPVRRVTIRFTRAVPDWTPDSGPGSFTQITTGDSEFVLAGRCEQSLSVGGEGYRFRSVETLRTLPRDWAGRFVVGLEADEGAPMLRLRWDPALEIGDGGTNVHVRERDGPPPEGTCNGVDRLRPSPRGGAADVGPSQHGPLRWILDVPGRVLVGGTWEGRAPDRRTLAPPPEARIAIRWKTHFSTGKLGVAVKDGAGRPLPFRCATDFASGGPSIFFVHDPETGAELHDDLSLGGGLLLGGLPAGRLTLVLAVDGIRSAHSVPTSGGETVTVDLP